MKKNTLIAFLFYLIAFPLSAQDNPLQAYIQEALSSNISLQQKQLSYEKSLAVLKEAKANFFPVVSLEARFSLAQGGRSFDLPVGDLVNPLYDNLNLINQFNQQALPDYPELPVYPKIKNESVDFLRPQEHDTKVRMIFPIYNTAIMHNQRIRQNQTVVEEVSVEAYRKELVKEVKTAYFNYQKASEALGLLQDVRELVAENLRTTESLFHNHKITQDAVFSAEREVQAIAQQIAQAEQDQAVAQAYFNFLLNREYTAKIDLMAAPSEPFLLPSLESARQNAVQHREELVQFNHYLAISDNQIDLNKGSQLPAVNLVVDYGFQGTSYSFTSEDDYAMGSLVLSMPLFNRSTKTKIQQAQIDKQKIQSQKEEVVQQIGLQVLQSWYQTKTALLQIELNEKEIKSAESAYRLVEKKYRQGQANLIELTDARTQWTNAQRKKIIATFEVQVKWAELEWTMGN